MNQLLRFRVQYFHSDALISCHIGCLATALLSGNHRQLRVLSNDTCNGSADGYRPHAVEQRNGYVKGVVRRFAQSSIDHRGTPDAPGRVVTVIDAKEWHRIAGSVSPFATLPPDERLKSRTGAW